MRLPYVVNVACTNDRHPATDSRHLEVDSFHYEDRAAALRFAESFVGDACLVCAEVCGPADEVIAEFVN